MNDNKTHEHRWAILAVLGLAQLMVVLDGTIVNIALPSAQRALHFSNDNRQWIVTAYALAFGALLLLGGKVSDLFGRKRTFIVGLIGFAIASAVGGAAQSFIMLAVARAFQGGFGALLAPAGLSLLTTTFTEPKERNTAFGIYGAIAGSGASLGLLLGGALTQALNWRYSLYVNVVLAVFAVIGGMVLLTNVAPETKPKLDWPGVFTVTIGLFAIVFGFNRAQVDSWTATITLTSLGVGVLLLVAFVFTEARSRNALLPLRVMADRNRGASLLAILIAASAIFGVFLFLTYYLQDNRGYSPVKTGLAFMPLTAMTMITSLLASTRLVPRLGPKVMVPIGMFLAAIGMWMFTRIGVSTTYLWPVLPALIVMGAGLGFVFGTAINSATLGITEADSGVGSALVNACQQVGGALGTALLSTIAASATTTFIHSHTVLARSAGHAAVMNRATIHGYTTAFWISVGLFVVGAIITALLYQARHPVKAEMPAEVSEDRPLAMMH